jgi:hypothetical protein
MKTRLVQRVYAMVVSLYPRRFRQEYSAEMKLAFNDLLDDPDVSGRRVWWSVLGDIANLMRGSWLGALFAFPVVVIWWAARSDVVPFDPSLGLVLIVALFVAAGFTGAWRSGSVAGGIGVGFVAGLVSAVTVPGEYWLFGTPLFGDVTFLVGSMAMSAAVVMLLVSVGVGLATFKTKRGRMRRSIHGFVAAWRQDSELGP